MVALRSPEPAEGEAGQSHMKYVYLLQSLSDPSQRYIGSSADFERRLAEHNAGQSPHTAKFRPWKPIVVIQFAGDEQAAPRDLP